MSLHVLKKGETFAQGKDRIETRGEVVSENDYYLQVTAKGVRLNQVVLKGQLVSGFDVQESMDGPGAFLEEIERESLQADYAGFNGFNEPVKRTAAGERKTTCHTHTDEEQCKTEEEKCVWQPKLKRCGARPPKGAKRTVLSDADKAFRKGPFAEYCASHDADSCDSDVCRKFVNSKGELQCKPKLTKKALAAAKKIISQQQQQQGAGRYY